MNAWRFTLASLRHYRRIHIAVMLGVAVATAVLTGALLVGDSVRGSLRDLTLERLGKIDTAVVSVHMFREQVANQILERPPPHERNWTQLPTAPAILVSGTLEHNDGKDRRRATAVSVIGCDSKFWSCGEGGPDRELGEGEVAISESLRANWVCTVTMIFCYAFPLLARCRPTV